MNTFWRLFWQNKKEEIKEAFNFKNNDVIKAWIVVIIFFAILFVITTKIIFNIIYLIILGTWLVGNIIKTREGMSNSRKVKNNQEVQDKLILPDI